MKGVCTSLAVRQQMISICTIGVPEGEDGESGANKFEEIMTNRFSTVLKTARHRSQEALKTPSIFKKEKERRKEREKGRK